MVNRKMKFVLAGALLIGLSQQVNAALVNAAGNVTETTSTFDSSLGAPFTIPATSNGSAGDAFVTVSKGYPTPGYFGAGGVAPVLVLDLGGNAGGGDVGMNSAAFWNYWVGNNDTSSFSLKFATAAEGPAGFGTSITYNPTFNPAKTAVDWSPPVEQDFAFSQTVAARYVQLTVLNNYGGDRVGLNDIQFNQVVIPEPASLGMGLLGLGLLVGGRKIASRS